MDELLRAVVVRPGEPAVVQEIDGSLEGLQALVGGLIQAIYPFDDRAALVCNDEGKLLGMDLNRALRDESGELYDVIAGPFVVVGLSEENFASLTPEQTAHYLEMYKISERFEHRDGKIVAIPIPAVMDFESFRTRIGGDLTKVFSQKGISAIVEPCNVNKIQSTYEGITVRLVGDPIGINLDLSPAYEQLRHGDAYIEVLERVAEAVNSGLEKRPAIQIADLSNYSWVKDHLSIEVINRAKNAELLKTIPHTDLADLAVVYRLHLYDRADGSATAIVTNNMLRTWRVSEEQLKADAMVMAERNHPMQLIPMQNILSGLTGQDVPETDMPMLVCMAEGMTSFGAGVIAYDGFGDKASQMLKGDFYICPASRHEIILIPDTPDMDPKNLEEMVRGINASDVIKDEDFLSDSVYHFDATDKRLELVADYQERKSQIREPLSVGEKKRGR